MGFPRYEYWHRLPFPSLRDLPGPGIETTVSCIGRQILYHWATREAPWSLTKRAQLSSLSSPHHVRMQWESSWLQARKRALTSTQPLLTSWSQTSSPNTCERRNFCCLSHPVYSILLWQPEQIKSSNQQILTECHQAICQAWGTQNKKVSAFEEITVQWRRLKFRLHYTQKVLSSDLHLVFFQGFLTLFHFFCKTL